MATELAAVPARPQPQPKTTSLYLSAGRELVAYLEQTGGPDEPADPRREHVEGPLVTLQEAGRTPSGVSLVYRSLQQLMKYLGQEGEIDRSPMEHMTAPVIPEQTTPVLSDDDLKALLATCGGRDFVDLRTPPCCACSSPRAAGGPGSPG